MSSLSRPTSSSSSLALRSLPFMNQDSSQSKGLLDVFKERVAQQKGRPSIEALAVGKGSYGGAGPFRKIKKDRGRG